MASSSSPINALAAGLVLMMAPIPLVLGAVGALSAGGEMRIVFFAMFLSGAAMLYGGVKMLRQYLRAVAIEGKHQSAIREAVGAGVARAPVAATAHPSIAPGETVLAHWHYGAEEWSEYTRAEKKRRIVEAIVPGVLILLVAALIGRGEEGGEYMAGGVIVATLLIGGGLFMARSAHLANTSRPGEAIITPTAILLNGRYHVLRNDTYRFEGVRLDADARPPVLEFRVGWSTRGGRSDERVRVPVPAGREAEAREVLAVLERT